MMTERKLRRRWDPVVKLTHWSIALAVLANVIITEEGSNAHVWVGYALAAILALRLLWGVIGPTEARFSAFLPSPTKAMAHLGDIRHGRRTDHASHNPLGTLMVYAIWACLIVIIGTGIAMAGLPTTQNPQLSEMVTDAPASIATVLRAPYANSGEDKDDEEMEGQDGEEGLLGEVHEMAANLLYGLILLHIAGVIFETRRSGRRIILAMVPGHR